jgi:hypothetical protein
MNTIKFKKIALSAGLLLLSTTGCMAQQPPTPQTPAASCPEVESLLGVLASKTLFDQAPESFLASSNTVLKVEKDTTQIGPSKITRRDIKFLPASGSWLKEGSLSYDIESNKAYFDIAKFTISSACFKSTHELIDIARKKLGKDAIYDKTPPPDASESLYWRRKDPDINFSRYIEVNASKDVYEIIANRDPSSEGAGG